MRNRTITITLLLLATVVQTAAQALTERYGKKRPVVIVCLNNPPYTFKGDDGEAKGSYIDMTMSVMECLDLPCRFVVRERPVTQKEFEHSDADLILADSRGYKSPYSVSKSIINYHPVGIDSLCEIHFISKDRQLIEQIDDQYMRLKQDGDIAAIQKSWAQSGHKSKAVSTVLYMTIGFLVLAVILGLACLLIRQQTKRISHLTAELREMISQARKMDAFYADEDTQAARSLVHKCEAILCNPFVAISFYDNNGKLVVQNDAMKRMDGATNSCYRQPLYNAKGEIFNYFVAVLPDKATQTETDG